MLSSDPRNRRVALLLLALAVSAPAGAQTPDRTRRPALGPVPTLDLPEPVRTTLPNGLAVVVLQRREVPLVQIDVRVRAGTIYDRPDHTGLAALTADMLDEGAGGRPALALADAFEQLGARFAIAAGRHLAGASLRVPVRQLEPAVSLLADVVLRPDFPAAELERLRAERLTALIRQHDEPGVIADAQFARVVFGDAHAYGRRAMGNEASIRSFDVAQVRAFHERHYTPPATTVYVVGDIAVDEALRVVRGAFGAWASRSAVEAPRASAPAAVAGRTIWLVDKPGAVQSVIMLGHAGVSRDHPDYYAIEVLNTILGGSFTSRLNQNLREDKGYTYGAGSDFDFGIGAGAFAASAAVQAQSTGPALAEFMNELNGIRAPIPEEELNRARNFMAMQFIQRFQSVSQISGQLAQLGEFSLPADALDRHVERVLAVTAADAARVARERIDPDNLAIVVVGDRSRIEEQVRALNLGELRTLRVTDVLGPVPVTGRPTS